MLFWIQFPQKRWRCFGWPYTLNVLLVICSGIAAPISGVLRTHIAMFHRSILKRNLSSTTSIVFIRFSSKKCEQVFSSRNARHLVFFSFSHILLLERVSPCRHNISKLERPIREINSIVHVRFSHVTYSNTQQSCIDCIETFDLCIYNWECEYNCRLPRLWRSKSFKTSE